MILDYGELHKKGAALLIEIYNKSFYSNYIKYGECPAYGWKRELSDLLQRIACSFIVWLMIEKISKKR